MAPQYACAEYDDGDTPRLRQPVRDTNVTFLAVFFVTLGAMAFGNESPVTTRSFADAWIAATCFSLFAVGMVLAPLRAQKVVMLWMFMPALALLVALAIFAACTAVFNDINRTFSALGVCLNIANAMFYPFIIPPCFVALFGWYDHIGRSRRSRWIDKHERGHTVVRVGDGWGSRM